MTTNYIGKPQDRVDGKLKVTGGAKYAGEFNVPGLLYGFVVSGSPAKGKITSIDTEAALAVEGVVEVLTHENRPHLPWFTKSYKDDDSAGGTPFRPLYDETIYYSGQPVALVVAEDFETARYAASLVSIECEIEPHQTDLNQVREEAYTAPTGGKEGYQSPPKPRGNPEEAFEKAAVQHEGEYLQPVEHHNPMEPHASTIVYHEDGTLTVYDKTQGVLNTQSYIGSVFNLSTSDVHVISPFVGGAFGSGLRPQYQLMLAVMAAMKLKRSVRVSLTRDQMFTFGHRPNTIQNISIAAHTDGTLESIIHRGIGETSQFEEYTENLLNWTGLLYNCANVEMDHKIARLDTFTPLDMRAPGAATGVYAIESAIDELAYKVGIDPLEIRLKNYAYDDQNEGKPFSSKELKACYEQGAEKFGWSKRNQEPRSMRDGKNLIGWGVATGIWEAKQDKASARGILTAEGNLEVASATADIGTGTYTICTQIAAETLGLPIESVTFKLGDSELPTAPLQGGSWTASSVGSAVKQVCEKIGEHLLELAQKAEDSQFADAKIADVEFENGRIKLKSGGKGVSISDLMRDSETESIEEEIASSPDSTKQSKYTTNTHSAVFVEVKIGEDLGTTRVTRVVSAIAGGRILNPKTAGSQIIGGVVWGISQALHEESVIDQRFGRFVNHNLAEYHVPVSADIPDIEIIFVDEQDDIVNPLGAKGLGEIGIVGVAAAVGNAIYHATGKRVRDLPFTIDKVL